jgi:predicted RNase H-like HicB family nuclease
MKDYHINIFYGEEDGGYIADIPDLEACSAFGSTPEQALAEVEKAKAAWLATARRVRNRYRNRAIGLPSTKSPRSEPLGRN